MGDVIEVSPSPEPKPRTTYRPLRRKRDTDGNESVIELSDSTDSQGSTQNRRVKRRKEAAESKAGPSTSIVRSGASSLRTTGRRTRKLKGQTPTSQHASPAPQRASSPVQKPHAHAALLEEQKLEVQLEAKPLTPPAATGTPQLPDHRTPPLEPDPLHHTPPPPASADVSEVAPESYERLVERVREVVPDVLPAHAFDLLATRDIGIDNRDDLLNLVIHILLEDRSYPKDIKEKGKARATAEGGAETSGDTKASVDYTHPNPDRRLGKVYRNLSLKYLRCNFPDLDASFISETLSSHENRYAPAYLYLLQHGACPISVLPVAPNPGKKKGKARSKPSNDEEEFMKEHTWLVQKLETRQCSPVPDLTPGHLEEGEGVECGCCFMAYPFNEMAQCTDTHLFCKGCVTSYTSTKVGEQNADLHCMDISGCKMAFPESELRRILPAKLYDLYEQIRQRRDIELAELEGLEECPFCDYKVVVDVDFETDKVLRCQNEECLKVSCRKCKNEDHLPKSCEEMEEDKTLDGKHAIEEAMTRALMRNCPKCQKAFVKEYGCNKMTCTYCQTLSCYVCREIIRGYDHFDQSRPRGAPRASGSSKKCPLWDSAEERHAKEVADAADKALKEYKTLHPDVQDEDIRVQLPPPPPPPPQPNLPPMLRPPGVEPRFPPPPAYVQVHHAHNAHMPIAHPVMALPLPPLPAPQLNPQLLLANGPLGGWGQRPLPRGPPMAHPMPLQMPQPYNPPLRAPRHAFPDAPHDAFRALPPIAMPPLPRPALQHVAPPAAIPGIGRMPDRKRRR